MPRTPARIDDVPASEATVEVREPAVSGRPVPGPLSVRVVETLDDFDGLEAAWTALHDAHGVTPFQSFPWLRTWWRHVGEPDPAASLHIVVVSRGDRVVAVAPWFRRRSRVLGTWPVTRLEMIGRDSSDYTDLLVDPDDAESALAALAATLRAERSRFDALLMKDVPDHSPSLPGWLAALERAGLRARRRPSDCCPRVRMADNWEATVAALPPATRGRMLRRQRQLVARHDASLELVEGGAVRAADIDALVALHQRRWTSVGLPGAFSDRSFEAFVREATLRMGADGRAVLTFLRLGGERVAVACGFLHRDECHYYLGGMNSAADLGDAARLSPGIALHLWTMEALHSRGVRWYDLLRGEERYKYDLGAVATPTWFVTVHGRRRGAGRWSHLAEQVQSRGLARWHLERRLLHDAREGAGDASVKGLAGVADHLVERAGVGWRDARRRLPGPVAGRLRERGPRDVAPR